MAKPKPKQNLFGDEIKPSWTEVWSADMPEFHQDDLNPVESIKVQFRNQEDRKAFLTMLGESPERRKSLWYPHMPQFNRNPQNLVPTVVPPNKYPIYVISKGRWKQRQTARALEKLGIPYHIVIEPTEYKEYAAVIDPKKILQLPFHDLGQGSIPARNWLWEHSLARGDKAHWCVDDNITGFYRLLNNRKITVTKENPFVDCERLTDKYKNVAISGLNYDYFLVQRDVRPPFYLNTRVYSCILIQNNIPYRWRGRYNEDTDLCIRALKDGWCTILLNAFLAKKVPTLTMKGGNADELYKGKGRLLMAQSLQQQHPDIVKITWRWGRPQHCVDYKPFKRNKLLPVDSE